ncbi:MAG: hypothetical protein Q8L06_18130, partial [Pseudohongiella sp.]|nr:hypothetical protein [Pseudohongiella sp.]
LENDLALLSSESEEEEDTQEEADPLLLESGRVLVDMAELLGKPMNAVEQSAPMQSAAVAISIPSEKPTVE